MLKKIIKDITNIEKSFTRCYTAVLLEVSVKKNVLQLVNLSLLREKEINLKDHLKKSC